MSMEDRDGLIWLDGEMVPWRDAKTHELTHTLHYGMGVFEGIRAYETSQGAAVFRLEEHIDRLFRSAHILDMPMPYDRQTLTEACKQAVKDNNDLGIKAISFMNSGQLVPDDVVIGLIKRQKIEKLKFSNYYSRYL